MQQRLYQVRERAIGGQPRGGIEHARVARVPGCVIIGIHHLTIHGERARDPYDLALRFAFERLLLLLEDAALRRHLRQLLQRGTGNITADRFQRRTFHIRCLPKGGQVCASPREI